MTRARTHRGRRLLARMTLVLFGAAVLGGCQPARHLAAKYPRSDLEAIYRTSRANGDRNPLILIPGFAGTTLVDDEDGHLVWGAFLKGQQTSWGNVEGLRALAVDIQHLPTTPAPGDLATIEDDASPLEMLERAQARGGIRFPVYSALVETVERGGYVDGLAETEGGGRPDAPAWFGFAYDWRQDDATNAARLGAFVESCRDKVRERRLRAGQPADPVRFDIIAHSMGGLVARYYLRYGTRDVLGDPDARIDWAGAEDIDRMIVVATPSFGTMKALRELVHGRKHAVLPTLQPTMLATWTSLYQMLPRTRHPLWIDADGERVDPPALDAATFRERGWGPFGPKQEKYLEWLYPGVASHTERQDRIAGFMDAAFERARQFHVAIDRHPTTPCPARLILFAGDADATLFRAVLTKKKGAPVMLFEGKDALGLEVPGDGTVARVSALADERVEGETGGFLRSPVPWDLTVFVNGRHAAFFGNPAFQNNLLHVLLDVPPRATTAGSGR